MILNPCNAPSILENYMATLVGTDSYVERSSRALLISTETHLEFQCVGNPLYMRIYFLTPRQSDVSGRSGGVPANASTIGTLLTNDDSIYAPGGSLATNLQQTLYDSPSVCREYQILRVTKWKNLSPIKNKLYRVKLRATYPKILDAGYDKIGSLWLYLKGSVIPVVEFKGFQGDDLQQVVTCLNVPANSGTNAYNATFGVGTTPGTTDSRFASENSATHINVSSSVLTVRRYDKANLKLESDEVREINTVSDVAPSGTKPYFNAPLMTSYTAA